MPRTRDANTHPVAYTDCYTDSVANAHTHPVAYTDCYTYSQIVG